MTRSETLTMHCRWLTFPMFLALSLLMAPAALWGQDKKDAKPDEPAPSEKPKEPKKKPKDKDLTIKGTLTGLVQEVAHLVPLKKDQAYEVSVTSHGFFTEIRVDDGKSKKPFLLIAGSKIFKSPGEGVFRFLVSSPGGSSGQYEITVRPTTLTEAKAGEILTVAEGGITIEAMLAKDDPLDKVRKKVCKTYDVQMVGGKTYIIDLISKQFDAFLRLEDLEGKRLAQDDDSGGGTNARIRFKAPEDGVYRVYATTFNVGTGLFLLKVREE